MPKRTAAFEVTIMDSRAAESQRIARPLAAALIYTLDGRLFTSESCSARRRFASSSCAFRST